MKSLKIMLLLIVLLFLKSIAVSQPISTDSLKCFTIPQAKQILKDLKKGEVCDSIVQNQSLQIINFKAVLSKDDELLRLNEERLGELSKSLNLANKKVKLLKTISVYGLPISFGAGIITSILLFK